MSDGGHLLAALVRLAELLEPVRTRSNGWTPAGELVANVMAAVAQWERRAIGQRTREALAVRRAQGIRLGRPRVTPPEVRANIVAARRRGLTFRAMPVK